MNLRISTRPSTSTIRDTRSSSPSSPEKTGATATWMTWCSNLEQLASNPRRYASPRGGSSRAVVATDPASVDADCDNGVRVHGSARCEGWDGDWRGALVTRGPCEEVCCSYRLQVGGSKLGQRVASPSGLCSQVNKDRNPRRLTASQYGPTANKRLYFVDERQQILKRRVEPAPAPSAEAGLGHFVGLRREPVPRRPPSRIHGVRVTRHHEVGVEALQLLTDLGKSAGRHLRIRIEPAYGPL